jgi:hypothetical protein
MPGIGDLVGLIARADGSLYRRKEHDMKRIWRGVLISALLLSTAMCASGGGGIGGCGAWSGWRHTGTTCNNAFWCFGKSQKGTYNVEEKTRECNNGIQRMTRNNFDHCGC